MTSKVSAPFYFFSCCSCRLEMKVMVKEAKTISDDVLYPDRAKKDNEGSTQIQLPQKLFGKYKGSPYSS